MAWLTLYVVLLFAIPSRLVVGQLGSAGAPSMLIGLMSLMLWALGLLSPRRWSGRVRVDPISAALAIFVFAIGVAYVAAMARPIDADEVSPADVALLSVASWSGTLLLTANGVPSRARLNTLVARLALAGGLMAFLGLLQFGTGAVISDRIAIPGLTAVDVAGTYVRQGFTRPSGTATHPIEYGVLMSMLLPFALHRAFHGTRSVVVRWAPVVALAIVLVVSFSRSAYLGALLSLMILIVGWPARRRRLVMVGIAFVLTILFVTVPGLFGSISGLFKDPSGDPSINSRTDSYSLAARFIGNDPLFGRGLGTFLPKYRIFDNQYLLLLVTIGVVGTAAFLAVALTAMLCMRRVRRASTDAATRDLALCLTASVASGTLSLAFFDGFAFPMTIGAYFLVLGVTGALWRLSAEAPGGSAPPQGAGPARITRPCPS